MIGRLRSQWFLVTLAAVLLVGASLHGRLLPVAAGIPRNVLVAAVMFLTAAPLNLTRALAGRSALIAAAVGIAVNAGLAAPLAWLVARPLSPPLAIGLIVAAVAPCTLASAAVWTRRGGGNEAVALLVTVVTNVACFATLPAWVAALLGAEHEVDARALSLRLLGVVVLPIAIAQGARRAPPVRAWLDRRRTAMGVGAQIGLLTMVFIGAVNCGELLESPEAGGVIGFGPLAVLLAGVAVLHLALFATAWGLARFARCGPADALSAAIGGSQKTLTVGLDVALGFGGLAILPMIVYHATQLLIDALLVERLRADRPKAACPPRT